MSTTAFKSYKDLPREHLIEPGTPMCPGCGGLDAVKQIADLLGERSVYVNAAGCMTMLSSYPYTPLRGSWLYTAMASAPAGAIGVRDALDILRQKGRLAPEDDMRVAVLSGDGSANGIGLSSTSHAIDIGLDFTYICYDNEGYGNTGQQSSPATPHGARTATSRMGGGAPGHKKDLFGIWAAHHPAYLATVIASEPLDLARKVEKALTLRGPKLFIALAPCPTGWHFDSRHMAEIGRLAVVTGIWPLKELVAGQLVHTKVPRERRPVEDYLSRQRRFAHLFQPQRDEAALAQVQAEVDAYWAGVDRSGGRQ